MKNYW